jgi:NADH pyrophosphatase NudC (nudix superfamily)
MDFTCHRRSRPVYVPRPSEMHAEREAALQREISFGVQLRQWRRAHNRCPECGSSRRCYHDPPLETRAAISPNVSETRFDGFGAIERVELRGARVLDVRW